MCVCGQSCRFGFHGFYGFARHVSWDPPTTQRLAAQELMQFASTTPVRINDIIPLDCTVLRRGEKHHVRPSNSPGRVKQCEMDGFDAEVSEGICRKHKQQL